jgi:hypothetical protein
MIKAMRFVAAMLLPLALSACFFMPGKFNSSLDLRKNGKFSFAYTGEVQFLSPDKMASLGDSAEEPQKCYGSLPDEATKAEKAVAAAAEAAREAAAEKVNDKDASSDAVTEDDGARPCTAFERAEEAKSRKAAADKKKKDAAEMGAVLGINPSDDQSMRAFATKLTKQAGWKSVTYAGNGMFNVDYAVSGTIDHDFIFPVFAEGQMLFPFMTARLRKDGSVQVTAPAFIGGGMKALMSKYGASGIGGMTGKSSGDQLHPTTGQFTIRTDGRILTNNTEDGPTESGGTRTLVWDVGPGVEKFPEALINLK